MTLTCQCEKRMRPCTVLYIVYIEQVNIKGTNEKKCEPTKMYTSCVLMLRDALADFKIAISTLLPKIRSMNPRAFINIMTKLDAIKNSGSYEIRLNKSLANQKPNATVTDETSINYEQ